MFSVGRGSLDDRAARAKQIDLRSVIRLEKERHYVDYNAGLCPFHEAGPDAGKHTASFLVYKNGYRCLSTNCGRHGTIFNWYAYKLYGDDRASLKNGRFREVLDAILGDADAFRPSRKIKLDNTVGKDKIDVDLLRLARVYHKNLLLSPERLTYFFHRGFTLSTIMKEMWGWDGKNYVITVWEGRPRKSKILSLRLRNSTEDGSRYSGIEGHNAKTLYNRYALLRAIDEEAPFVVVFYGEFDARLAWQDRIYAVSPTNGAKSLDPEWFSGYEGDIVIFPDVGEETDAYKDAGVFGVKGWVGHFPRGAGVKDYTEYRSAGYTPDDFLELVSQAMEI